MEVAVETVHRLANLITEANRVVDDHHLAALCLAPLVSPDHLRHLVVENTDDSCRVVAVTEGTLTIGLFPLETPMALWAGSNVNLPVEVRCTSLRDISGIEVSAIKAQRVPNGPYDTDPSYVVHFRDGTSLSLPWEAIPIGKWTRARATIGEVIQTLSSHLGGGGI